MIIDVIFRAICIYGLSFIDGSHHPLFFAFLASQLFLLRWVGLRSYKIYIINDSIVFNLMVPNKILVCMSHWENLNSWDTFFQRWFISCRLLNINLLLTRKLKGRFAALIIRCVWRNLIKLWLERSRWRGAVFGALRFLNVRKRVL